MGREMLEVLPQGRHVRCGCSGAHVHDTTGLNARESKGKIVGALVMKRLVGPAGRNPSQPHQEGDGYQTPEARPWQPMIAPLSSRTTRSGDTKSVRPTLTA